MSEVDDFIEMHFKALLQTELQSQSLELLKQPCCFVVIIFFANYNEHSQFAQDNRSKFLHILSPLSSFLSGRCCVFCALCEWGAEDKGLRSALISLE